MADLYDETYGRPTGNAVDGFSRLSDDQLRKAGIDPNVLDDAKTGFKARIYGDSEGRIVLAYSGTDEGKDWLVNFGQGLGFETTHYNQAMALARDNAGSVPAFAEKMTQRAHALGAESSHFQNPHGLHDPHHYTTARDLARIGLAAMKNPLFREIVVTPSLVFTVMFGKPDAVGVPEITPWGLNVNPKLANSDVCDVDHVTGPMPFWVLSWYENGLPT